MLRQMLKLRQARKAFDEGRFRDAFDLAADPEIAEHVKAIKLRQACLDALGDAVADHERKGELTLALQDVNFLRERGGEARSKAKKAVIENQIEQRDGLEARVRARFYRARLDAERGDLISARTILDGIDRAHLTAEMEAFRAEIDAGIRGARLRLDEGLAAIDREPRTAEEKLEEAAKLHPRAEGLAAAWAKLAALKVKAATSGKIGDPALAAFLTDWGLFKRRHLDGSDGAAGAVDEQLLRHARKRIRARLDEDEEIGVAARLIERLLESLRPDAETEALAEGISALQLAIGRTTAGDYESAREALAVATEKLGRGGVQDAVAARLERHASRVEPQLGLAKAAELEGDLVGARRQLLDVLESAPEHQAARQKLADLESRSRARLELLLGLHADLEARDLTAATKRLAAAPEGSENDPEIADLLRAIELRSAVHSPQSEIATQEEPARGRGRPTRSSGGLLRISIEEEGELLVVEDDVVSIGNATARKSKLRFLAPLGPIQARIERRVSFHAGLSYCLKAESGREVAVAGDLVVGERKLMHGDEIRLGRDLRLRFELPVERSRAALLTVLSDHDCEGCQRIVLMPPQGRSAAIVIGPFEAAHVTTSGFEGEMEIFRETTEAGGALMAQGPLGLALDGDEARARVVLHDHAMVKARDLVVHLRRLSEAG